MNDPDSREARRKRRRKRRLTMVVGFVLLSIGMAWFFESQATTTVIVTRYSDVSGFGGSDPGLTPAGERRAQELSRVLGDVDVVAGVDVIFVTSSRRSRETSVPLAMLNDAPVHTLEDPAAVEELVERIITEFKGEIVLVVTEPEHIQPLIAEMQGSKKLPDMSADEYDNLYIVTIPWFGKVKTLRLRYGAPFVSTAG